MLTAPPCLLILALQDVTSTKGKNPPGGASQIVFGDYAPKAPAATTPIKTLDAPSPARQSGTAASFYHSPTSEGPAAIPAMPAIVAGAVPMYGGRPAVPYGVDKLEDSPKPKSGQASIPSRPSQLNNYARLVRLVAGMTHIYRYQAMLF